MPVVHAVELAPDLFKLPMPEAQGGSIPYAASQPLDRRDPAITQVIFAIHSSGYDALEYRDAAAAAAGAAGRSKTTLIVAPQLLRETVAPHSLPSGTVLWKTSPFWGGQQAVLSGSNTGLRLSAFEILDALALRLAGSATFPQVTRVVVLGHSAGGQLTQRYAALNKAADPLRARGITMRFVVLAPSSYLYFTPERRVPGADAFRPPAAPPAAYDRYGYGLDELYAYMKGQTRETIRARYPSMAVLYAVGARDVDTTDDSFDRTPPAMLQGRDRVERATVYAAYLKHVYGAALNPQLVLVPGVGHWGRGLLESPAVQAFIFQ